MWRQTSSKIRPQTRNHHQTKKVLEEPMRGRYVSHKGTIAQGFLCQGPALEAPSSSCPHSCTTQLLDCFFLESNVWDSAAGNLRPSVKERRRTCTWEWECVHELRVKRGSIHQLTEMDSSPSSYNSQVVSLMVCEGSGSSFSPKTTSNLEKK